MEAAAGHLLSSGGVLAFLARPGRGVPGRDVRGLVIWSQSRLPTTNGPTHSPSRGPRHDLPTDRPRPENRGHSTGPPAAGVGEAAGDRGGAADVERAR